jgi:hypothetical protein
MNRNGHFLLLMLCAGLLVGAIGFEARMNLSPATEVPPSNDLRLAARITPLSDDERTDDWTRAILARPLFSPSRRPPRPAPAAGSGPAVQGEFPRLAAVLIGPSGRSAIFAGSAGSKPIIVREGDAVASFVVRSIEPGRVTLDGPSGRRELRPVFVNGSELQPSGVQPPASHLPVRAASLRTAPDSGAAR